MKIIDLGLIDYKAGLEYQKEIFAQVKVGVYNSVLITCSHYPVITLGRQADKNNIFASEQELENKGISMVSIERGGDVTYHAPGQLIIYPVFDLNYFKKDIHWFLRELEGIVIDLLADFGIQALRKPGFTGVWIGSKKISSIGIAIRNWITFHGVSLNVKESGIMNFKLIRPCGLDIEMISLEKAAGRQVELSEVKDKIIEKFANTFSAEREEAALR